MRSHDWSRDRSNLIGTILYHSLSQGRPFINNPSLDLPNQPLNQPFVSTYTINFFIKSTTSLVCGTSLFLINVRM